MFSVLAVSGFLGAIDHIGCALWPGPNVLALDVSRADRLTGTLSGVVITVLARWFLCAKTLLRPSGAPDRFSRLV